MPIIFSKGKVLVKKGKEMASFPDIICPEYYPLLAEAVSLNSGDTSECFQAGDYKSFELNETQAVNIPDYEEAGIEDLAFVELRKAYNLLCESDWKIAAKASELLHWNRTNRYCPKCGTPLLRNSEISKICPSCGNELFPSPSAAILVLIEKGDEALLVHARNFRNNMYALVAGFVESGENLEECVRREVKEETSLDISDIRYFGSQSWPFPFQLMIAFRARYAGGEILFADNELTSGGWFSKNNPPLLPTPPSLSRSLIDAWLKE